jgi:multidrug efflux pump subunit AcrA (membrane-fusion protein)
MNRARYLNAAVTNGICRLSSAAIVSLWLAGCHNSPAATTQSPAAAASAPTIDVVTVESGELARHITLPAELRAFQDIELFPKVDGFISYIPVDRGSHVK